MVLPLLPDASHLSHQVTAWGPVGLRMVRRWGVLLTLSLNAGDEVFPSHKGSSLVFRENPRELHSPLTACALENLPPERTPDSLVPVLSVPTLQ